MAAVDLPFTVYDPDRHGNPRWYVRAPKGSPNGGRKIRLRGEPGSAAFIAAYWEARNVAAPARAILTGPPREGSFRQLVTRYYASAAFAALDATHTQVERRRQLDPIVDVIGDKPALIDRQAMIDALDRRKKIGKARARKFLAAMRHVYAFALEAGLVREDPTAGLKAPKPRTSGFHSWSLADCLAFEAFWPIGTKQRTAYAIGLYLLARRSDAIRIGRPHLQGDRISYTQHKNRNRTPVRMTQPMIAPLVAALDGWQGKGLTFLETKDGVPYSDAGFGGAFASWCAEAGLQGCSFHGLRKAAAARLAELGYSTKEISAALGDKTLQQAEVYTRAADAARLADTAISGLAAGAARPKRKRSVSP